MTREQKIQLLDEICNLPDLSREKKEALKEASKTMKEIDNIMAEIRLIKSSIRNIDNCNKRICIQEDNHYES